MAGNAKGNNMANEIMPINEALQTIATTDAAPVLQTDGAGIYRINGGDELLAKIDKVIDYLDDVELTEDDRDMVRATRKFTNDFIKAVDRSVIDERARVFDPVNEERKAINERMGVMKSILAEKLEQFDQGIRAEKRDALLSHFRDEQEMGEHADLLSDVSFEMVENQSWFNRSASEPKSRQELSARIKSLASAMSLSEGDSVADVVAMLVQAEWSLPDVIVLIQKRKHEAEQQRLEQQRRAKEIEDAEQRGRDEALEQLHSTVMNRDNSRDGNADTGNECVDNDERTVTIAVRGDDVTFNRVHDVIGKALGLAFKENQITTNGVNYTVTTDDKDA